MEPGPEVTKYPDLPPEELLRQLRVFFSNKPEAMVPLDALVAIAKVNRSKQAEPTTLKEKQLQKWIKIFDEEAEGVIWATRGGGFDFKTPGPEQSFSKVWDNKLPNLSKESVRFFNSPDVTYNDENNPNHFFYDKKSKVYLIKPSAPQDDYQEFSMIRFYSDIYHRGMCRNWDFKLPRQISDNFEVDIKGNPDLILDLLQHYLDKDQADGKEWSASSTWFKYISSKSPLKNLVIVNYREGKEPRRPEIISKEILPFAVEHPKL